MRSVIIRKLVLQIVFGISLILLIFGASRLVLLLNFGNASLDDYARDLLRMFWLGARFDLRIATISLAPFLVMGFILLRWKSLALSYIGKIHCFTALIGLIFFAASVCNYYYYATFGNHFDIFIFGFIEEDTKSVLHNIIYDYPIFLFLIGTILAGLIFVFVMRLLWKAMDKRSWKPWSNMKTAIFTVVFVTCYAIATRGSLGKFPLRKDNAQVSSLKLLNMATPNAITALQWAISDHKKEKRYPVADDEEGEKLFSRFLGRDISKNEVSLQHFMDRTPENPFLDERPPHVIFVVMESLSAHLLSYDAPPERDFLGAWRTFWEKDFTFMRFLPDGNGTMESLAMLLVASPVQSVTQSRAQRTPFESNLVIPYKRKGYRTVFVYSGNGSWRNICPFLTGLGFDEVVEQNDLVDRYPGARLMAWGTFDEYSFRYAQERLDEADKKGEKLFILILTITNHSPYEVPETWQQPPHELNDAIRQRLSETPYDIDALIASFQYANDALGRMIQGIDEKPYGKHTLIAVTGDHNMRALGYPDPKESALRYSVPFYLHAPPEYQKRIPGIVYDPRRVGGHKDIMPTLYCLSLSDTPYYRRGVNLLAENVDSPWYFGYNEEIALTGEGAYQLTGNPAFYPWQDDESLMVSTGINLDEKHQATLDRILSYKSLMRWQLNRQVNRQP
ncbi:sulfatase-like hydrolase/transferase [Candidatus Sumerlaeota bacterium]|nr:sulfatase-like hydrolase/transferase [Candidatus Sumerlaeota bacterium]